MRLPKPGWIQTTRESFNLTNKVTTSERSIEETTFSASQSLDGGLTVLLSFKRQKHKNQRTLGAAKLTSISVKTKLKP